MEGQRTAGPYISVAAVGEIERGITQQQQQNLAFDRDLGLWLDRVLKWYEDRIHPVDLVTARRWGQLSSTLGHDGADLLIAATALDHGAPVVTRNVRHFEPTGVGVVNPGE